MHSNGSGRSATNLPHALDLFRAPSFYHSQSPAISPPAALFRTAARRSNAGPLIEAGLRDARRAPAAPDSSTRAGLWQGKLLTRFAHNADFRSSSPTLPDAPVPPALRTTRRGALCRECRCGEFWNEVVDSVTPVLHHSHLGAQQHLAKEFNVSPPGRRAGGGHVRQVRQTI